MVAFVVYAATLAPGIPAGDSGELIAVAATLGVAHPPGYPLYTLLGHLWIAVLPLGAVAWRMNLLSALCAASAVAVLAGLVRRLTGTPWAALASAWLLAFSPPLWKSAVVAEVFALNALLAACLMVAFACVLERASAPSPPRDARPLWALALLSGLAVTHHHSLVLLALPVDAAVAVMIWAPERAMRRLVPGFRRPFTPGVTLGVTGVACFGLGLAPLVYLPIAAARTRSSAGATFMARAICCACCRERTTARSGSMPYRQGIADRSHVMLYLESCGGLRPAGVGLSLIGLLALARRPLFAATIEAFAILQAAFFMNVHFRRTRSCCAVWSSGSMCCPTCCWRSWRGWAWPRFSLVPLRVHAATGLALARRPPSCPSRGMARVSRNAATASSSTSAGRAGERPRGGVLFVRGDVFHNALACRRWSMSGRTSRWWTRSC
jgi:hypothetical protein